jgi:hypothetical protein
VIIAQAIVHLKHIVKTPYVNLAALMWVFIATPLTDFSTVLARKTNMVKHTVTAWVQLYSGQ